MGVMRRAQPAIAWLLVATQLFFLAGCRRTENRSAGLPSGAAGGLAPGSTATDMGVLVYDWLERQLQRSPTNPADKVAALQVRRAAFIDAINRVFTNNVRTTLVPTLQSLLPLVDDGTISAAMSDLDTIISMIVDEPGKQTLQAMATLQSSRGIANDANQLALVGRLLNQNQTEAFVRALALIVEENDGRDATGQPNGERDLVSELLGVLSRRLEATQDPQATPPGAPPAFDISEALLRSNQLRGYAVGDPAWAARADLHGNARVATNPLTGQLYAPFVDQNGDGAADVDARGQPVDTAGAHIDIPAFGQTGPRDRHDRALAPNGATLYDYFDAKQTPLAEILLIAGELIRRDVPADAFNALTAIVDRTPNDNGTPFDPSDDFSGISPEFGAIDVAWGGLEVMRQTPAPRVLTGLAELIRQDPDGFEEMVLALSKVISILQQSSSSSPASSNPSPGSMLDDLIPLLDETFEVRGGSQSAARTLLDVLHREFTAVQGLPAGFADMARYSDYRNRITTIMSGDKSSMERLLDMMEEANQCSPILLGNMAEFYLDAMAGNRRVLGISLNIRTINRLVDIPFLRNLLCSQISSANVRALHDFADSGALDAFIPIARAFSLRGETRLLKDIMLTMQRHYAGSLRPNEPTMIRVLESGAVEKLFEAVGKTTQVTVPGTTDRLADVVADTLAAVVDDDRVVVDRRGRPERTLLHLVTEPMRRLDVIAAARGAQADLQRAVEALLGVVSETIIDPQTGQEQIKNHCVLSIMSDVLVAIADQMPSNPTDYDRRVRELQAQVEDNLTSRDMATLLDFGMAVEQSGSRTEIWNGIAGMLSAQPHFPSQDVLGALLPMLASGLQVQSDPLASARLARFVGRVMAPDRGLIRNIVVAVLRIFTSDQGLVVLALARNLLDEGPNGTAEPPLLVVLDLMDALAIIDGGHTGHATASSIEASLRSLLDQLRDPDQGVHALLGRIRRRAA